ncbi:MAG: lipopolysaccharide transport periplasmic protein LptA [Aeromonadaceae bacterium]|nr:lipopolysaccharide transport periplasmic protein LptA [Aeromonadaceae bacterium]
MVSTSTSLKWCLLALCLQPALAKQSDYQQKVYVDSVRQVAELNDNKLTFLEDVVIRQGTIEIRADKVEVIRHGDKGADEMIATGRPARFHQVLDNGKPVDAQANRLSYKLKERLVVLSGNARIQQSDNQISGDQIRYDIQKQQMMAESSAGSRVKTIFLPEEISSFDQPAQEKP